MKQRKQREEELVGTRAEMTRRQSFLVIHHIDWDPSNNSRGNLAVLCRRCHARVKPPSSYLPGAPRIPYPRRKLLKATAFRCQSCGWSARSLPQPVTTVRRARLIRECAACKRQFIGRKSGRKYDLCPRCNGYFAGRLTGICIECGAPAQSHDLKLRRNGKEVWVHQMCPPFLSR